MFNASAIILAGGKSRRMGENKSLMDYNGVPMIEHIYNQLTGKFNEIFIGSNDIDSYQFLNLKIVKDQKENCGPLMGIMSSVAESANDLNFVVACDIPQIKISFLEEMFDQTNDYDIVMPVTNGDKYETLFAIYRKSIIKPAQGILDCGKRRIIELFKYVNVKFIEMPKNDWYANINTIDDYKANKSFDL